MNKDNYISIDWPDSQSYMDEDWFKDEAIATDESGIYLVPKDRVKDKDCLIIDNSYIGTDVDLETALHEYGLAAKEVEEGFHIVYGVKTGDSEIGEPIYTGFDHCTLTSDEVVELLTYLSDEDIKRLNESCDTSYSRDYEVSSVHDVVGLLSDLFWYWGASNFFSPYYNDAFKIKINQYE